MPADFELNKAYETTTVPGTANDNPIFLGVPSGRGGMTYFVDNVYPPDGGSPSTKVYCKVVFTKKQTYLTDRYILHTADGNISGYALSDWGKNNPGKYIQRWDFTVDFTGLKLDE